MSTKNIICSRSLLCSALLACLLLLVTEAGARGILIARGNGIAAFSGTGQIEISGSGLFEASPDALVEILEGSGETIDATSETKILYINFSGKVRIRGENISARFNGANIVLRAEGQGNIRLKGVGFYISGLIAGSWNPTRETIIIFSQDEPL